MKSLKNRKSLNNKKGDVDPIKVVIGLILLAALVFIFFNVFFPIITGKQAPWFRGQIDYASTDCDGDGVTGLTDQCPCAASVQTKENNQACPPILPSDTSFKNCPELCKAPKQVAKK